MTLIYLAVAGVVAWIVSTLSGGGGALLLVPAVSYLAGTRAVAPVVTLTTMLGSPARIYLFGGTSTGGSCAGICPAP